MAAKGGTGFSAASAERINRQLDWWRAENARRIPCQHCPLMILPETMEKHVRICHSTQP